jgi:hypothetical protein
MQRKRTVLLVEDELCRLAQSGRPPGHEAEDATGLARPHSGEDDEEAGAQPPAHRAAATASTSDDEPRAG